MGRLIVRATFLGLLFALLLSGYLIFEFYLKPWGRDRLRDTASTGVDITNALVDGVACVHCMGVNNVYPVTATSHPTYGGFERFLQNESAWLVSTFLTIGVVISGGGSLLFALLQSMTTTPAPLLKPTSSTAHNGCGLFELVLMLSQAQFITLLGTLHLNGLPRFFLEFAKKLAWTNLQIFPPETSYKPTVASMISGSSRRLETINTTVTGVERYAQLLGAKPQHFFYYTCAALAVALGCVLVVYLFLRVMFSAGRKRHAAATLDHRVIWVFLFILMLAQYVVSMTSCFQIDYASDASHRSTGDVVLPVVVLAAECIGLVVFAIIKIARHREEVVTHGTPAHDTTKWFHLRYSVFYQEYNLDNLYFFVLKMILDMASGAVVGTVHDGPVQIALLMTFNGVFLALLIWREPFLVPLFYYVAVLVGYVRIVLLFFALVQARTNAFPQDVRDYVGALMIAFNLVLLLGLLVRMFYVLSVAIYRWASRAKHTPPVDQEMGIPLQDVHATHTDDLPKPNDVEPPISGTSTKMSSSRSHRSQNPTTSPIPDSTLFSLQPYHAMDEMGDNTRGSRPSMSRAKTTRHSMPGYSSAASTDGSAASAPSKGGGRRSMYARRAQKHRQVVNPKNDDLPDWAKV